MHGYVRRRKNVLILYTMYSCDLLLCLLFYCNYVLAVCTTPTQQNGSTNMTTVMVAPLVTIILLSLPSLAYLAVRGWLIAGTVFVVSSPP